MNPVLISVCIISGLIILLMILAWVKPEFFGFFASIFLTVGLLTVFFTYLKPELEKLNDPGVMAAFWVGTILFCLFMFIWMWFMIRRTKKLKKSNRQLKAENKMLRKQRKKG